MDNAFLIEAINNSLAGVIFVNMNIGPNIDISYSAYFSFHIPYRLSVCVDGIWKIREKLFTISAVVNHVMC